MSPPSATAFQWRMAVVFVGAFLPVGLFNPFFPPWLAAKGLTPDDIALLLAAQTALRVFVSPFVLRAADRARDRAFVLFALGILSALAVNLLFAVEGFGAILIATLVIAAVWAPIAPLSDAIALSGVRRLGADYGAARLWGSFAFIVANVAGGFVLARTGVGATPVLMTVGFVLAMFALFAAPRVGRPQFRSTVAPVAPAGEPVPAARLSAEAPRFTLRPAPDIRAVLVAILAIAIVQASHGLFYAFSTILWNRLGYGGATIGVFWAIGVVAEILVFRFARPLKARVGTRAFLVVAALAAMLRWALFTVDVGVAGFLFTQALHGLSFGAAHIALQFVISDGVAEDRLGAAQGFAFAVQTGLVALATLASGPLFGHFGAGAFWFSAFAAAVALGLAFLARYPQSAARGGNTREPS